MQESLIRQSTLDWTIVRPARFRRNRPGGLLQAAVEGQRVTLRGISRKEIAEFVLDVLEQHRFVRQAVFIGHP